MEIVCVEDENHREMLSYSNENDYLSDINDLIDLIHGKLVHYKDIEYSEYKKTTKEFFKKIDKYQEQPYVLDTYLEKLCSPLANCIAEFLENNSLVLHNTILSLSKTQDENVNTNSESGLSIIENLDINIDRKHQKNILRLSDCIYNLCKIRGSKVISLYFPSNVNFLEVVIDYISLREKYQINLECEDILNSKQISDSSIDPNLDTRFGNLSNHSEEDNWHFIYILYVWLSTLVLIPFSFEVLDSKYMLKENSLFLRILENVIPKILENKYCITNETASIVFAKITCRTDFTLLWKNDNNKFKPLLSKGMDETPNSLGILIWIKYLIKLGPIESIEIFIDQIIRYLNIPNKNDFENSQNPQNKYDINSYKSRSCRTICITRLIIRCVQSDLLLKYFSDFENVIDWTLKFLIEQNKSENNLLRHTSSKCIAKILSAIQGNYKAKGVLNDILMLNNDEKEENVERIKIFKELSPNELEGKCLTIAELLRARLTFVFEDYLPEILEFLQYCLNYEYWIGTRSFGVQIRDSACYIIWSLARGVPPQALRPYSNKIISSIIPLTVFDSQINGRRSSCAALQELIGRLGGENISFGISIVTIADFFSISSLKSSFLEISTRIGALDTTNENDLGSHASPNYSSQKYGCQEGSEDLIYPFATILSDYLVQNVFIHPNIKFRLLSTIALSKLVPYCHHLCFFNILPFVSKLNSINDNSLNLSNWNKDLNVFSSNSVFRHSSLLIISVLVSKGLILKSKNIPFWNLLTKTINKDENANTGFIKELPISRNSNSNNIPMEFTWSDYIRNIPILIEKNRLYRGKGGDLTRKGVLNLIISLSRSTEIIPFKKATFSRFLQTICESIKHLSFSIQISGCSALDAIIKWRMTKTGNSSEFLEIQKILVDFVQALNSESPDIHIMALRGIILSIGIIFPHVVNLIDEKLINDIVNCLFGIFNRGKLILRNEDSLECSLFESSSSFNHYIFSSKYDVECRRNSIWSLGVVCYCMRNVEISSKSTILNLCHDVFVQGCFDYSTDKRGDVGSWIREISMETLACLYSNNSFKDDPKHEKILSAFIFNIFNYSDKLRVKAILLLWKLLYLNFVDSNFKQLGSIKYTKINIYWIYYRIFHGIPFELFEICQIKEMPEIKLQNLNESNSIKYKLFESCQLILNDVLKDYILIHSKNYIEELNTFFGAKDNPFNSGCYYFDMLDSIEKIPHSLLPYLDFENQFLFCLSNRNFQILSNSSSNVFKKCLFPFILEEELQKSVLLGLINWINHSSSMSSSSSSINPYQAINYELNIFLKSAGELSETTFSIFNNIEMLLKFLSSCKPDAASFCTCMTLHVLQFILVLFTWGIFPHEKTVMRGILTTILHVLRITKDFQLIKISSAVLVHISFSIQILDDDELAREAMESLSDLVSHQYPNIRAFTTDYIYNNVCHIQTSEKINSILEYIRETNWTQNYSKEELNKIKTQFRFLCQLEE
ncbi:B-tubulin specific chaparone [Cryptosporidium ubiquitum]|uniref:B-tubulin specific chaparone n=1 Tax=Cryptosporidium ubiquitum TaxID=857276 RepID=A0A1J4M9J7_9CRYT|nr:B-tubulin specific chaparone [Cryptosporidium ubiquitum]OII70896.1 B-tubulin specific chaparone [Cryptosporidium ubiquitum]